MKIQILCPTKKQSSQLYNIQTFSLCRCGFKTEEPNGGNGSVLVRCSRSELISQQLTSCLFWRVLRTTHRYRMSTSIQVWHIWAHLLKITDIFYYPNMILHFLFLPSNLKVMTTWRSETLQHFNSPHFLQRSVILLIIWHSWKCTSSLSCWELGEKIDTIAKCAP